MDLWDPHEKPNDFFLLLTCVSKLVKRMDRVISEEIFGKIQKRRFWFLNGQILRPFSGTANSILKYEYTSVYGLRGGGGLKRPPPMHGKYPMIG